MLDRPCLWITRTNDPGRGRSIKQTLKLRLRASSQMIRNSRYYYTTFYDTPWKIESDRILLSFDCALLYTRILWISASTRGVKYTDSRPMCLLSNYRVWILDKSLECRNVILSSRVMEFDRDFYEARAGDIDDEKNEDCAGVTIKKSDTQWNASCLSGLLSESLDDTLMLSDACRVTRWMFFGKYYPTIMLTRSSMLSSLAFGMFLECHWNLIACEHPLPLPIHER